jgi:hypothetical protein
MLDSVEPASIRLDIQERRTIQYVHTVKIKYVVLSGKKLHNTEPDAVWPPGCACGEHASFNVLKKWFHGELHISRSVKMVNEIDVREALEVV